MEFSELMDCHNHSEYDCNQVVYDDLIAQLRRKNVVPVIGAGLSAFVYPQWNGLLEDRAKAEGIWNEVETCLNDGQYEEAAELLAEKMRTRPWKRFLLDTFSEGKIADLTPEKLGYRMRIPQLFPELILTLNFDRVLEKVFGLANLDESLGVLNPSDDFTAARREDAIRHGAPLLLKLHGDFKDFSNMVLTKAKYDEFYGSDPKNPDYTKPLPALLKRQMQNKCLLFLGCSLGPDRICTLLKVCAPAGKDAHFTLLSKPESEAEFEKRRDELEAMGVQVIWYPAGKHTESLTAFFTQLAKDLGIQPPDGNKSASAHPNPRYKSAATLYGRDADIRAVVEAMTEPEARVVWVEGPAGIGKTEVCKAAYREIHGKHPDWEMPFIDVNGVHDPVAFYSVVSKAAEISLDGVKLEHMGQYLLAALHQKYTRQKPAPALYFDNWEELWNNTDKTRQQEIVGWLVDARDYGFSLLFSSQASIPDPLALGRLPVPLGMLGTEDSRTLFLEVMGERNLSKKEEQLLNELLTELEGHPLAIVLTATQARNEAGGIAAVRDCWEKARQETTARNKKHESLATALRVVWGAVKDKPMAVLHWVLHYYSQGAIPEDFYDEELRGDFDPAEWNEGRNILYQQNLLQKEDNGYRMYLAMKKPLRDETMLPEGDDLWRFGLLLWAKALETLLKKTFDYTDEEKYLKTHYQALELFPQLCYILRELLERAEAGGTDCFVALCALLPGAANYLRFDVNSERLLSQIAGSHALRESPRTLAQANEYYGDVLFRLGRPREALRCYEEAEKLYRKVQEDQGLANTLFSRGEVLQLLGQPQEALRCYEEVEKLYRKEQDDLGLANTLHSRGEVLRNLGQPQEALRCYEEAEKLYRKEHSDLGLANTLRSRGQVLRNLGQPQEALQCYEKAEKLYRKVHSDQGLAHTLRSRGQILDFLGQPQEALQCYEDAEELYRKVQDGLGLAHTLLSRGQVLQYLGQLQEALRCYEKAEKLYRKEQDDQGLANTMHSRGQVLRLLGLPQKALQCYEEAEELYRKEQDDLGLANTLWAKGVLLQAEKKYEEALKRYQEAETLYIKVQEPMGLAYTRTELYCCYNALGQADKAEPLKAWLLDQLPSLPVPVQRYIRRKLSVVPKLEELLSMLAQEISEHEETECGEESSNQEEQPSTSTPEAGLDDFLSFLQSILGDNTEDNPPTT
ncbi:MAG: tetratricopeptide repeat protein [Ruminococcaceae bacterium]|nr:tetratricopeptide repeat protein [Oscillospiraceae bacterium]